MQIECELLTDERIYDRLMKQEIPSARRSVLIATALVKQTNIELGSGQYGPFLDLVARLAERGVKTWLLLAGKPSASFMETLRARPAARQGIEIRLCARNHMKVVLIDGDRLYLGSANLTGAGMGRKHRNRRNFEFGIFTSDATLIRRISAALGKIWEGAHCGDCQAKRLCWQEHERFSLALSGQNVPRKRFVELT